MKNFLTITILSTLLLLWCPTSPKSPELKKSALPTFFAKQKSLFNSHFKSAENGHIAWAFLTGEKSTIHPKTKNNFYFLQLGFLFSPSGLHFSIFFLVVLFFLKLLFRKKVPKIIRIFFLGSFYFLPFLAIKRIIIMRILMIIRNQFKLKINIESLFFLTFMLAFLLGHFKESPFGFIFSFLFMGTFISLRNHSRSTILLGTFASHQLICLFLSSGISPWALIINIPLLGFFPLLYLGVLLYFLSFHLIAFNWIEPFIRIFTLCIRYEAKFIHGTEWEASLGLLLALWIILLKKPNYYLILFILLHCASASAPTLIQIGHS